MPFGPTNAPSFYTAMMKDFKTEWDDLFLIRVTAMQTYNSLIIRVDTNQDAIIVGVKLVWGSKTIIDDILLWCDKKYLTLLLFTCVCEVFQKYRMSFRLDKCEFFKKRVEYVRYDILRHGNSPAQSKFNLLNNWELPKFGQSLFSFIGLVNLPSICSVHEN